jgi:Kelch motif
MAQQALGAGSTVPRRRVLFGALDADGWAWAGVKATFWLIVIIMLLGYLPDRAYYLTVNRTVELGVLVWSPINLCPPENESLPCPAPVGSVAPWHPSPDELALPAPRTSGSVVQTGTKLLYIGGSDGDAPQANVFVAEAVSPGNFDRWSDGPALPEPRADATVLFVSGSIYVIGGYGSDGQPTSSVFVLTPDGQTGDLGEWTEAPETLLLPEPRAGASGVSAPSGVLIIGGVGPDGPVATTWKSPLAEDGALQAWEVEADLAGPQADGTATLVGDYLWLWGGRDANGPVATVQRGEIGLAAAAGLPENPDEGKVVRWAVDPAAALPVARADAAGWSANGAIYIAGGADATGPQTDLYWAEPEAAGNLSEWKHLDVSDLPSGVAGSSPIVVGPNAVLVGGATSDGATAGSLRASIAPMSPFFQLGLAGATVPGLRIEGEIGQQLGYLNAAGAGTVGFVFLILIGWAFAHQEQTRSLIRRITRR